MAKKGKGKGRGWHGDAAGHARAASKRGKKKRGKYSSKAARRKAFARLFGGISVT